MCDHCAQAHLPEVPERTDRFELAIKAIVFIAEWWNCTTIFQDQCYFVSSNIWTAVQSSARGTSHFLNAPPFSSRKCDTFLRKWKCRSARGRKFATNCLLHRVIEIQDGLWYDPDNERTWTSTAGADARAFRLVGGAARWKTLPCFQVHVTP